MSPKSSTETITRKQESDLRWEKLARFGRNVVTKVRQLSRLATFISGESTKSSVNLEDFFFFLLLLL